MKKFLKYFILTIIYIMFVVFTIAGVFGVFIGLLIGLVSIWKGLGITFLGISFISMAVVLFFLIIDFDDFFDDII